MKKIEANLSISDFYNLVSRRETKCNLFPFLSMAAHIGDDRIEDLAWLCSLSESELDLLISLKKMVLQRAKMIGHEELAEKFDLRMLRAIGLVLMEYLKVQIQNSSIFPGSVQSAKFLDVGKLLCVDKNNASIEDIMQKIGHVQKQTREKAT